MTYSKQTSLHIAAKLGYSELVKILLEAGAKIDLCDKDNWSLLEFAVTYNQPEIVKILIMYGEDPCKESSTLPVIRIDELIVHNNLIQLFKDLKIVQPPNSHVTSDDDAFDEFLESALIIEKCDVPQVMPSHYNELIKRSWAE